MMAHSVGLFAGLQCGGRVATYSLHTFSYRDEHVDVNDIPRSVSMTTDCVILALCVFSRVEKEEFK